MNIIDTTKVVQDLVQRKGAAGRNVRVVFGIDRSVSTQDLYESGVMQKTIERILPIGAAFGSDKVDIFVFEDGVRKIDTPATLQNYHGYVDRYISELPYGGTRYTPIIQAILDDCGASRTEQITYLKYQKPGLFGSIFGKKEAKEQKEVIHVHPNGKTNTPTLAIILTDGDAEDDFNAKRLIIDAAKYPVFLQFIGVQGTPKPDFKFLRSVDTMADRFIDNVNLFEIKSSDLTTKSDEALYNQILGEFTEKWLPAAKHQFLIK